jgi:hypothetical protein
LNDSGRQAVFQHGFGVRPFWLMRQPTPYNSEDKSSPSINSIEWKTEFICRLSFVLARARANGE